MSLQVLEKLFGSSTRVKVMKLFIFNPGQVYEKKEIVDRTQSNGSVMVKELNALSDIGLLKKRVAFILNEKKSKKTKKQGYILNDGFMYLNALKNILANGDSIQQNDLAKKLSKAGTIKLLVVAGLFIKSDDSRIDLLVVGDEIKDRNLKNIVKKIESEIGRELRYSVFSTADFKYRYSICDRLTRDVFDYPHEVIVDKIGL